MKNMASWLITIFIVMFWIFRFVACYTYSMGTDIGFRPFDMMTEIIVLFITFVSILLIISRKRIGGIIYLATNGFYFGSDAINGIMNIVKGGTNTMDEYNSILVSMVAIILGICTVMDLLINKDRAQGKDNKDTFWFYKNNKYERKLDDRADKNQYRINR